VSYSLGYPNIIVREAKQIVCDVGHMTGGEIDPLPRMALYAWTLESVFP